MKHNTTIRIAALIVAVLLVAPLAAQVKDVKDIKYPKLPDFKIPQPEVYTLANGMQIFLMEDHELPLINVTARIRTGSNYDPADKVGLGGIFGQVQREGGTKNMSGRELNDFLEARAASVETSLGGDVGFASMDCLKEDFADVFAIFRDVLRYPVFDEEKIELAKVQTNTGIARRNDQIAGITGREFSRLMYGKDTALGRLTEYATVNAITRDDLLAWHEKFYHPNQMMLGVVGDFDPAEMRKTIEATFGDWEKGPDFSAPAPSFAMAEPGSYFIEKEDVTQAYVRIGHLGIQQSHPDYHAVQVMNEILSGSFASRLFSNVRSAKGLAYSVFGGIGSSFVRPGIFQVGLSTKSETMAASVDALREEIDGIINIPPTKDEMSRSKESILNSFIFNYTSRSQILGQQMTFAFYGMPEDFLATYRDKIEAVSAADVTRVAKTHIHPDNMVLMVVGKSADFDRPMDSFGTVKPIDIAIAPPADNRGEVVRSAANVEAGAALVAKAGSAVGGGNTQVEAVSASYDLSLKMGGQSMQLVTEVTFQMPDKVHTTIKTPMGDQVIVLNGKEGYQMAGGQSQPLGGDRVQDSLKQLPRDLLVLATHYGNAGFEAVATGESEVNGAACTDVSVVYMEAESRICIDGDGTVLRQAYQGKHPLQGTPGLIEVVFENYEEVDGMMVPKVRTMNFDGQEVMKMSLKTMDINPELDQAMFAKPN